MAFFKGKSQRYRIDYLDGNMIRWADDIFITTRTKRPGRNNVPPGRIFRDAQPYVFPKQNREMREHQKGIERVTADFRPIW